MLCLNAQALFEEAIGEFFRIYFAEEFSLVPETTVSPLIFSCCLPCALKVLLILSLVPPTQITLNVSQNLEMGLEKR